MTIPEILSSEDLRRHEFPVVARKVFLAHAAVCPLPYRVGEAMAHAALNGTMDDQEVAVGWENVTEGRARAARLIGAQPEEIAFVGPTSLALSYVAAGLPLRKGDNIVIYHDDYPANVYPLMALAQKGVKVRMLNVRGLGVPGLGRIRLADVLEQVDESTRLVALSSCHFVSGWRLELAAIGAQLRKRGVWFCVDGIQTLGAFPTLAAHVDFLAADAHKWMLGPCGAGLLYVRREIQEIMIPVVHGWHNVRCPNFVAQNQIVFQPDARRYEVGTLNMSGFVGLNAAMALLLELGVENIAAELLRKRAWFVPALLAKGWEVLHADCLPANAGGIISLRHPKVDMAALHARLAEAGIVASLRGTRTGEIYLRFSPHFYNTDAELEMTLEALGKPA
jgi:selenocysteine lyase/cysteine desulfurase